MDAGDRDRAPMPDLLQRASARGAGLHYVGDGAPGLRRRRAGKGCSYFNADGARVTDRATLERIRALAIPPAYRDVWICADPRGHLQATGRDARGRKQYRYHPRWRQVRDLGKFDRVVEFGERLPALRRRLGRDLKRRGLPREKVLAIVVSLLAETLIRVGNHQYARDNNSFGLTTLRNRHVRFPRGSAIFSFRGKSGKEHRVKLGDARLARLIRSCQQLPGQRLFQYLIRSAPATSMTTCMRPVAPSSAPRTSAPGAGRWRPSPRWCVRRRRTRAASAPSRLPRTKRCARSPPNWATRRPSAAPPTSIRPFSSAGATAAWPGPCARRTWRTRASSSAWR